MNKLIFKKLLVFSSSEKKSRTIEFSSGKTVVTSSSLDGTNRGKSVIMKSLYHTMGADCFFDDKWNDAGKTYIVEFEVDATAYFIYRCNDLFKVFNANRDILFATIKRRELAEWLSNLFHFVVKLPNRTDNKLELTPPAYMYLLYFLDQNKQKGSKFDSFKKLEQYANYKENLLWSHFGTFNEDYYNLSTEIETVKIDIQRYNKDLDLTRGMFSKVCANIQGVAYSKDLEHLRDDVERNRIEYNTIATKLSDIRAKLIALRNDESDLRTHLSLLGSAQTKNESQISSLLNHTCPLCNSRLDSTEDLRVQRYSTADDIILLTNDINSSILSIASDINKLESEYNEWSAKLNQFEETMGIKNAEVNDILRHKGLLEIRDGLSEDLCQIQEKLSICTEKEKNLRKKLKNYNDRKAAINEKYYERLLSDRNLFGLEEIDPERFKSIKGSFTAGGSNNPVATAIWYVNLIRIKNEFNPAALRFPVVFDSPNNTESDSQKRFCLYQYLVENLGADNQFIVSGIGLDEGDFSNLHFDKIIRLTNDKYELLDEDDYKQNEWLLLDLTTKEWAR